MPLRACLEPVCSTVLLLLAVLPASAQNSPKSIDASAATPQAEVLVLCKKNKEFEAAVTSDRNLPIIDFVRLFSNGTNPPTNYEGICW